MICGDRASVGRGFPIDRAWMFGGEPSLVFWASMHRLFVASPMFLATFLASASAAGQNAEQAAEHSSEPHWEMEPAALRAWQARLRGAAVRRPLRRQVFGYLPYWGGDWTLTRFDLLTSISYFAIELDPEGNISQRHGWGGATSQALVDEARRWAVKVSVSVTLFGDSDIAALLSNPARRARAIDNLLAEVHRGGAEGISIDFEFVPRSAKEEFVAFMQVLSARLWSEIPGSEVSIAMPAVDWSGAYDFDRLAAASDLLFIMGYGYHWSGSGPGPLAPIASGTLWSGRNLTWTIEDYVRYGGESIRAKLILGLPFYGRSWPATSSNVPAARGQGDAPAILYRNMSSYLAQHPRQWDSASETPYLVWPSGGQWRQLFYDDAESWRAKLELVEAEDVAGVGIWALTYERGTSDLWDTLENALIVTAAPDAGLEVDAGTGAPDGAAPAIDAGEALQDAAALNEDAADLLPASDAGGVGPAAAVDTPADPGCGCVATGHRAPVSWVLLWILAAGGVLARRRRR